MATIVSLHAHPDDEALLTGGWLAQRAAAGDRVVLVFATDGDAGLTAATRAPGALGQTRRREAAASARAVGAARIAWLGYADSGMANAPTTGQGRLVDTPVTELAQAVATILNEENADILTGYDANGGYGHPDHIQVHRIARAAQQFANRRPLLLEATLDRTWLVRILRLVRPLGRLLPGLTIPGNDIYTPRTGISHSIDIRNHLEAKRAALAAHASQTSGGVRTISLILAMPRPLGRRLLGTEWFHAVL
ncbi:MULTISPECIES: PIG-L family deacetylase [unclassified Nocardioides]|uniref:PIG-L family deacetylase n=1 Tax=unclassified Nocardioides TaxID=2615069 RepID=UPI0000570979|nr:MULTISPECIES: PIG-L family deacetylase [unclassified Nocardioides]ABL81078.1 LmbE family protein [Nocardioides sp. JS614]